jgi:hypothetical protein
LVLACSSTVLRSSVGPDIDYRLLHEQRDRVFADESFVGLLQAVTSCDADTVAAARAYVAACGSHTTLLDSQPQSI